VIASESIQPKRFRQVLSLLPTGVTVITGHGESGPIGMTANSFTSVSLEPPLVLFCPAKNSSTWPLVRATQRFCVNVLAGHHEPLSRQFALKDVDRFAGVSHHHRQTGPAIGDAVAHLDCAIEAEYEAGDHIIVVARVLALDADERAVPLLFHRGSLGPSNLGSTGSLLNSTTKGKEAI
jgi:3-hydroxy-9,10-secoandrosta-1,3,5(10)-triene-9,17-dione monooxygenase reductase component